MRKFRSLGNIMWGEMEVVEINKDSYCNYTLTQKHKLFDEDYYTVSRFIAVHNVPANVIPEKDFYVYRFTFMDNGCSTEMITDENAFVKRLFSNFEKFLKGEAYELIREFYYERYKNV